MAVVSDQHQSTAGESVLCPGLPAARTRRLSSEFAWVAAGQGLAALGALVGVGLLTKLMDPQAYGELALGMTVATLVQQVLVGPLAVASQRFYCVALEREELPAYLATIAAIGRRLVLALLGASLVIALALWTAGLAAWLPIVAAALLFALLAGINAVLDSIQNAARNRKLVAWHQALSQWLRFGMAAGVLVLCGATSSMALAGYALSSVVVLISQAFFFRSGILPARAYLKPHAAATIDWQRRVLSYGWPFASWASFSWALAASDRWALAAFGDTASVGYYAVLYQLGYYPILLATELAQQFFAPILFSRVGDGSDSERRRLAASLNNRFIAGTCLLTATATAMALALHEPVFRTFLSPKYSGVSWLLPCVVLSGGLFASGQAASLAIMSGVDSTRLVPAKIITSLAGMLLHFIGAYAWGLYGVVHAGIAFSTLYFAWMLYLAVSSSRPAPTMHQSPHTGKCP